MIGIIDTSSMTYRQIMGNGIRYEIPKFQRDYTWDQEQWEDLWQDIQAIEKKEETEHYLGYLVMQSKDNKNFQIIDGQQRLTTMSLLVLATIKCLDDLYQKSVDKENNAQRKDTLFNSYIGYKDPVTLVAQNKLKLNKNSDDYYRQHIVLLKNLPLRNTNNSEKQLRESFIWYYDRISKNYTSGEKLAGFIDYIVDKLFFTVIKVNDQVNAFKVFETLNARGVQLSSADLLKNYLFSVVDNADASQQDINELENIWGQIVGKLGNYRFEDYLRYFWNSSHKTVSKKNLFKAIKQSIVDKQTTFQLLRDLLDSVDLFLALQDPYDVLWKNQKEIQAYLVELKLFEIKQTYSLFIAAYKHLSIDVFTQLVKYCAIISFRYNIIGGKNPNEQENIYNSLALKIVEKNNFDKNDLKAIYMEDSQFIADFSNKIFKDTTRNNKIIKHIFSKIEECEHRNSISIDSDIYTIEHILPQSADETWGNFSQDAIDRSIPKLGNLTLLEKNLNQDCGIISYEEKKALFLHSKLNLTKSIPGHHTNWNEERIQIRQQHLAKIAKQIWRIDFN